MILLLRGSGNTSYLKDLGSGLSAFRDNPRTALVAEIM
jgi:hypothetical protein